MDIVIAKNPKFVKIPVDVSEKERPSVILVQVESSTFSFRLVWWLPIPFASSFLRFRPDYLVVSENKMRVVEGLTEIQRTYTLD